MNCESVRDQFELLAMGELTAEQEAEVRHHLEGCAACREEAERYRSLAATLREYAAERPLQSSHFAMLSEMAGDEIRRARQARRWHRSVLLKVAAGILIAVGIGVIAVLSLRGRSEDAAFQVVWKQEGFAPLAGRIRPYPSVQGRTLLTLEGTGGFRHLAAIDKETGIREWTTGFAVLEAFDADTSRVYAWTPSEGGVELVALDHDSGHELWRCRRPLPRDMAAAPSLNLVAGGVCWAEGGTVHSVDRETGQIRWSRLLSPRGRVTLACSGDRRIYVATVEDTMALDAADGRTIWQRPHGTDSVPPAVPLVACDGNGCVYVAMQQSFSKGHLRCYDAREGSMRWHRETGVPLSLQVTRDQVMVRSSAVEVFDARNGSPGWKLSLPGCGPVAWTDGKLYVLGGKDRPEVFLLDGRTGRRLGTQPLVSSCTGLVIDGRRGYLSGNDGVLYAMSLGG